MSKRFDLFMFDREQRPMWIAALDTLQEARERAKLEGKMLANDGYTFRVHDCLDGASLLISLHEREQH